MKSRHCIFLILFILIASVGTTYGQRSVRGIVVDSTNMKSLPGVYVRVKGTNRVTSTDNTGTFRIATNIADTLILTMVGYNSLEVPLFLEEEDIMIRMSEKYQLLDEVTITSKKLFESNIIRSERTAPQKMTVAEAFNSPWTYFSKDQKERRKVTRLINENDRIRVYIQVINDQETREDIMYDHHLTEVQYYGTLAQFNQQSSDVLYSTDPNEIIDALKGFFARTYQVGKVPGRR